MLWKAFENVIFTSGSKERSFFKWDGKETKILYTIVHLLI